MTDEFAPSDSHLALIAEVEGHVAKWQPRMPWLDGWKIVVVPIPDGEGEWGMHVNTGTYVRGAKIGVRESVRDLDGWLYLEDEYSVELVTVHELCHIAVEPMRNVFWSWTTEDGSVPEPAHLAMTDAEEPCVWNICRMLLRLERELAPKRRR